VYCYSFSKALLREWRWSDRYPRQPEILRYLNFVADQFDLKRSFIFGERVIAAHYDDDAGRWQVTTDQGRRIDCRYLLAGVGLLSAANLPAIPGRESFGGEQYHTGNWPRQGVGFAGKRVGVIGTGSTGVQLISEIAGQVEHLTVFQRSPQYSVPARHGPLAEETQAQIQQNYDQIWARVRSSGVAFDFPEATVSALSVDEAARQAEFERGWQEGGGFRFMFGCFNDIATDPRANEMAAEFIRGKIREIVKDPRIAQKLLPDDLYAKRPLCDPGYYQVYNRDNVELVDVRAEPIETITHGGVRTRAGEYPLDMLVFATGFDAVTGNYTRMDIRGRGGQLLADVWADGPTSYAGMANHGFPNLFMVEGPNGPFTNLPPTIETQVEWISGLIAHGLREDRPILEARAEAESRWLSTCREIADQTLFPQADSWIFGSNVPGKARAVMFYLGGLGPYRQLLGEQRRQGYPAIRQSGLSAAARAADSE
jgi:cation diffusion facilitator CzcD-associated flavoprotein CzcO